MMNREQLLTQAKEGDIRAFHELFTAFQPQLKSYLYRLMANRNDMEDLAHDVFIISFENIKGFRGAASLKTWVFTIATNEARRRLKNRKKWVVDTLDRSRQLAHSDDELMNRIEQANQLSPQGAYEIREHIDYCFTCVSKMLPLQQQIALILKDIYGFKIKEIGEIMDATAARVKHYLHNARQKMIEIFNQTCALVNQNGICNQCSELNGKFNPKQNKQEELMKIKWVKNRDKHTNAELLRLRAELVKGIDPLLTNGADLHEAMMSLNFLSNADAASTDAT